MTNNFIHLRSLRWSLFFILFYLFIYLFLTSCIVILNVCNLFVFFIYLFVSYNLLSRMGEVLEIKAS